MLCSLCRATWQENHSRGFTLAISSSPRERIILSWDLVCHRQWFFSPSVISLSNLIMVTWTEGFLRKSGEEFLTWVEGSHKGEFRIKSHLAARIHLGAHRWEMRIRELFKKVKHKMLRTFSLPAALRALECQPAWLGQAFLTVLGIIFQSRLTRKAERVSHGWGGGLPVKKRPLL